MAEYRVEAVRILKAGEAPNDTASDQRDLADCDAFLSQVKEA